MLFDLQSPRRRRVIRVTFGALAAIFAISFVFLGVGTGSGGFSFSDLFGSGGGGSAANAFDDEIKAAEQQLALNPTDPATLGRLVQLHYQAGNADRNSDGTLTSDGEQELREAADAWTKYVKASNGNPDQTPALFALNTFDQLGQIDFQQARTDTSTTEALTDVNAAVDDWRNAAQAQQALIDANPKQANPNTYGRLASYLYLAGDTQGANQAVARAKQEAKGSQASTLQNQLKPIQQLGQQLQAAIKQLTKQQQKSQAGAGAGNPLGGTGGGGNPLGGIGTGGL
ncbi:MAG TPA: hypothetical protein VLB79_03085 [Solirubrobacterales bacterium]|nr:hypothetical protein [Solirubrobacterales bacterium]